MGCSYQIKMKKPITSYISYYDLEVFPRTMTRTKYITIHLYGWCQTQAVLSGNKSYPLQTRHNGGDGVTDHQPHHCLLNRLFRHRSKKTSKLRVSGLCAGNSPMGVEFPAQRASNAKNVSIWWRHHVTIKTIDLLALYLCNSELHKLNLVIIPRLPLDIWRLPLILYNLFP